MLAAFASFFFLISSSVGRVFGLPPPPEARLFDFPACFFDGDGWVVASGSLETGSVSGAGAAPF